MIILLLSWQNKILFSPPSYNKVDRCCAFLGCTFTQQAVWIRQVRAAFKPTLALHQKLGPSFAFTQCCILTGAFSRKYIISFHAASSCSKSAHWYYYSFSHIKTKKEKKKKHYPCIIIFCATDMCVQHAGMHAHTPTVTMRPQMCETPISIHKKETVPTQYITSTQ